MTGPASVTAHAYEGSIAMTGSEWSGCVCVRGGDRRLRRGAADHTSREEPVLFAAHGGTYQQGDLSQQVSLVRLGRQEHGRIHPPS